MKRDATGPALSAIFVDYDNIYLSLKRKSDEAAKRFSKDAGLWLRELESGRLITTTTANGYSETAARRIVMNRCYGNPVPRRNSNDNSTDMNSFPFVRHHFLRAGSEVVDCPPLTAQLKNSADIRIVMDVRDMISHDTYFDEFIILSGDADFTPLLHRLRAHARRTVIYSNDHTASPYTAISDGEVREADLLRLLADGSLSEAQPAIAADPSPARLPRASAPVADLSALRREIVTEVVALVRSAQQPVPLEALADRAVRQLGHEKTAGSGWGGMGGFRDLLTSYLPEDIRLSDQAPFVVFEVARSLQQQSLQQEPLPQEIPPFGRRTVPPQRAAAAPAQQAAIDPAPVRDEHRPAAPATQRAIAAPAVAPMQRSQPEPAPAYQQPAQERPAPAAPQQKQAPAAQRAPSNTAVAIQQSVARIYEACQAPPLSPPEYRALFDIMAEEIATRGLTGAPTLDNIANGAKSHGIEIRRDDVRFVLEVVSEADPWFEQGASAPLFASRFRNFVIARCRSYGLNLSAEELDLIEHWFAGTSIAQPQPSQARQPQPQPAQRAAAAQVGPSPGMPPDRWWSMDQSQGAAAQGEVAQGADDFPRIIRTRMRG
jgi:NYN domain